MKAYVYNVETKEIIFVAEGETNKECELMCDEYLGCDEYAMSYSDFGLIF